MRRKVLFSRGVLARDETALPVQADGQRRRHLHQRMHAALQVQGARGAALGPAPGLLPAQVAGQRHVGLQLGAAQIAGAQEVARVGHGADGLPVAADVMGGEPVHVGLAGRDHAQQQRAADAPVQACGHGALLDEGLQQMAAELRQRVAAGQQRAQALQRVLPQLEAVVVADLQRHQRRQRGERRHPAERLGRQQAEAQQQEQRQRPEQAAPPRWLRQVAARTAEQQAGDLRFGKTQRPQGLVQRIETFRLLQQAAQASAQGRAVGIRQARAQAAMQQLAPIDAGLLRQALLPGCEQQVVPGLVVERGLRVQVCPMQAADFLGSKKGRRRFAVGCRLEEVGKIAQQGGRSGRHGRDGSSAPGRNTQSLSRRRCPVAVRPAS
ncbi:hypothetical protein [Massilia varians]|uniref:hypothetical protein n=1 Tax=Massilia varians TaxID=457921 RepID=UPI00249128B0|nr:hypothetical protein [Massilia varians]